MKKIFIVLGGVLVVFAIYSWVKPDSFLMQKLRSKHPQEIGAIAESSRFLAEEITRYIPKSEKQKEILEVGAGTGVFTRAIAEKLAAGDHLDVIELLPELCEVLQKEFEKHQGIDVHCIDIMQWQPERKYDFIVSGLPFNSFPRELVEKMTTHIKSLAKPEAIMSFFEYKWLPAIRPYFMNADEKAAYAATRQVIDNFIAAYEFEKANVYLNLPSAVVHHLRIK